MQYVRTRTVSFESNLVATGGVESNLTKEMNEKYYEDSMKNLASFVFS